MSGSFWADRRPSWVVAGGVVAAASLTVLLFRQKSGGNTATILSLTVSLASLGVALWGLRPGLSMSQRARDLAGRVAKERGRARRQALGMSGDARPAEVTFRWPAAADPELVRWRSDGGTAAGTLNEVAAYYRSLERGRMVVLGPPGAGKTVLATQLVLDLVQSLPAGELTPGDRPPVPVWLSLPSLDLGEPASLAGVAAEDLATRLDKWIVTQLDSVYQLPRATAQRLLTEQWVVPVLDGLDEMDAPRDEPSEPLPLATAVVRALNAGTGRRPVVLVCRRAEYGQLARGGSAHGEDPVLQDATQILLERLEPTAIGAFLARRFPGQAPGDVDERWRNVRDALADHTATPGADGLTETLSNPWQLFLATAAYTGTESDPDELIGVPGAELAERLIARLIPALTEGTPRPDAGYYRPADVRTWLGTLARHLEQTSERFGWPLTDIHLERLWPIGGQDRVRKLSGLATSAVAWAAAGLAGLAWVSLYKQWDPGSNMVAWGGLIGALAVLAWASFYLVARSGEIDSTLSRLDLRLPAAKRRELAGYLTVGLIGGLVIGAAAGVVGEYVHWLQLGRAEWLYSGVIWGVTVALSIGLAEDFTVAEKPSSVMRQNLAYTLIVSAAFAIALSVVPAYRFHWQFAVPVGLAVGLTLGLMSGLGVWIRYAIGCSLARRQGLLPRHVGPFMDWAYQANLLRMSGTAIQFRHRELQTWLASTTPPAAPIPAAPAPRAPQDPDAVSTSPAPRN